MAITKQSLRDLYAAYEQGAQADAKAYVHARDAASQDAPELFLTPGKMYGKKRVTVSFRSLRGVSVQDLVAAYASMGVSVQIDANSMTFSPDDLRKLVAHDKKRQGRFDATQQGIPYSTLIRASTAKDKLRAKSVRNAMLYGRKGDTLLFQVTGNAKPHYRVRVRIEGWKDAVIKQHSADAPPLLLAKQLIAGNLSIDCSCGRHQFWYRYLACIGNYAIEPPSERDFPKIRNPTLTGCCCKHVLKVLSDCKSNRILLLLAREIEKTRKNPGTVGKARTNVLTVRDLRVAQAQRLSRDAMKAFRQYEEEAKRAKKSLTPKKPGKKPTVKTPTKPAPKPPTKPAPKTPTKKPTQTPTKPSKPALPTLPKNVLTAIRDILKSAKTLGMSPDLLLDNMAKAQKITRAQLDAIIKEHKL